VPALLTAIIYTALRLFAYHWTNSPIGKLLRPSTTQWSPLWAALESWRALSEPPGPYGSSKDRPARLCGNPRRWALNRHGSFSCVFLFCVRYEYQKPPARNLISKPYQPSLLSA